MTADAGRFREETMDAQREEDWDLWLSRSLARLDEQNGPPPPWRGRQSGTDQRGEGIMTQPVITLPLAGLPDSCGSCGESPRDGRWTLGVYGHEMNVTCPACFVIVAPVEAVAVRAPHERVLELAGTATEVRDYSGYETNGRLVGWNLDPAKVREAIRHELGG